MSEAVTEAPSAPGNGAAARGAGRPSRAQVLAGFEWSPTSGETPAKDTPSETPAEAPATEAPVAPAETPPTPPDEAGRDESGDDDATEAEPAKSDETKVEAKPDPETAKRLSAVQKAEARSRELIAKERAAAKAELQAEIERVRSEISPHMDAIKAFKAAQNSARVNPVALLRSLGVTDDDFEYVSQQIYNHSKAAAADPKRRMSAEQAQREREREDKFEALQRRLDALETEKQQATQQAQQQQLVDQYLERVTKAVSDETPLVAKLIAKNPAKARQKLHATAERLYAEHDEVPDPEDVLKAYETERALELADLDIDVASLRKPKSKADDTAQRPAKTLDASAGSVTKAKPLAQKPSRDEMLKNMPWDRDH